MSEPEKCYSSNAEQFFDSLDDVVSDIVDQLEEPKTGDLITLDEGDKKPVTIQSVARHVPDQILDSMGEEAFENAGDASDEWPNLSGEKFAKFKADVLGFLEKWFKDNGEEPDFFGVENVHRIQVRLLNDEGTDYEVVR